MSNSANSAANTRGLKPWKPGQSGNPNGRPKRKPLTDALLRLVGQKIPKNATGVLAPLAGKKWADVIALGLATAAAAGEAPAFREAADRIEGKVKDEIQVSGSIDLDVVIREAYERARKRSGE